MDLLLAERQILLEISRGNFEGLVIVEPAEAIPLERGLINLSIILKLELVVFLFVEELDSP